MNKCTVIYQLKKGRKKKRKKKHVHCNFETLNFITVYIS